MEEIRRDISDSPFLLESRSQPVLSRDIHAATLAYSYYCHWGMTVLLGVLRG